MLTGKGSPTALVGGRLKGVEVAVTAIQQAFGSATRAKQVPLSFATEAQPLRLW